MNILKVCPVVVNYDQYLESMISQGGYSFVNQGINSRNFPSSERGARHVDIQLVNFDYEIQKSMEASRLSMLGAGLRPATLKELVTLGNNYQNLQAEIGNMRMVIQILSLAQALSHGFFSKTIYFPFLREDNNRNELALIWLDHHDPMWYVYAGVKS